MLRCKDSGIVVASSRSSESSLVLSIITESNGLYRGYMKGGKGKNGVSKLAGGLVDIGSAVNFTWVARHHNNLGNFTLEIKKNLLIKMFHCYFRLILIKAAGTLINNYVAEREVGGAVYSLYKNLIEQLEADELRLNQLTYYNFFELALLEELGFGLSLASCAATGSSENLRYVSPKSASAICLEAGRPYHERLLTLPNFIVKKSTSSVEEIRQGLTLTGYFLTRYLGFSSDKCAVRRAARNI